MDAEPELINKLIHNGVAIIPIKPDRLALNMAPGMLPLAIETITTDDETVDGKEAIKNSESHMNGRLLWLKSGCAANTSRGNNINVEDCTKR